MKFKGVLGGGSFVNKVMFPVLDFKMNINKVEIALHVVADYSTQCNHNYLLITNSNKSTQDQ